VRSGLGFVKLDTDTFAAAKSISIDYAVMEKTSRTAVAPVACGWSDVGSWLAVWEIVWGSIAGRGNNCPAQRSTSVRKPWACR
jgi:mannose-1-phosphate guanylyltransferase